MASNSNSDELKSTIGELKAIALNFHSPMGWGGAVERRLGDLEARLRAAESAIVRHAVYASIGAMVGSTIVAVAIRMLF